MKSIFIDILTDCIVAKVFKNLNVLLSNIPCNFSASFFVSLESHLHELRWKRSVKELQKTLLFLVCAVCMHKNKWMNIVDVALKLNLQNWNNAVLSLSIRWYSSTTFGFAVFCGASLDAHLFAVRASTLTRKCSSLIVSICALHSIFKNLWIQLPSEIWLMVHIASVLRWCLCIIRSKWLLNYLIHVHTEHMAILLFIVEIVCRIKQIYSKSSNNFSCS